MKKAIIGSSLAAVIGLTGLVGSHNSADAAENTNHSNLVQLAQSGQANNHAVQSGAYDYKFNENGMDYHFWSDGVQFGYEYHAGNSYGQSTNATNVTPTSTYTTSDVKSPVQVQTNVQEPKQVQTSYEKAPMQVKAPTQVKTTQTSTTSTGGSTKAQFLANGGTEAMWQSIVMPESGGNPNAQNPAGYSGLGQTMEGWGKGSVASQTKGMLNYAKDRYGSIDKAIDFRQNNGWW